MSWWKHLQRKENRRLVKKVWEAKIQTREKKEVPRQTWGKN